MYKTGVLLLTKKKLKMADESRYRIVLKMKKATL